MSWDAEQQREYHRHDRRRRMLYSARKRAKDKGLPCTITLDAIQIPDKCPILGYALVTHEDCQSFDSPSLDRIDSRYGYVPWNVQVISNRANAMKSDASPAELIRFGGWIARTYDTAVIMDEQPERWIA